MAVAASEESHIQITEAIGAVRTTAGAVVALAAQVGTGAQLQVG